MSFFKLKQPMGSNYRVDPGDIVNTKSALNELGYYQIPERGLDDWTDDSMFQGIRSFQKANGLKVDGFMRPEGPTETAINASLAATNGSAPDNDSGGVVLAAGRKREPNVAVPSVISPNQRDENGRPVLKPIPPGWEEDYPGSGTYWSPDGKLHRLKNGWFGTTFENIPNISRPPKKR